MRQETGVSWTRDLPAMPTGRMIMSCTHGDKLCPVCDIKEIVRIAGAYTGAQGARKARRNMTDKQRRARAKKAAAARWATR